MKALKYEIRSLVSVGILVGGISLAFPISSLAFRAEKVPIAREASAAFVILTPEKQSAALRAARTAWQNDATATERMRVRFSLGELPEEQNSVVYDPAERAFEEVNRIQPLAYTIPPFGTDAVAASPERITCAAERKKAPEFSREELLDLN